MLDIKLIRENPEKIKERLRGRNGSFDAQIDELISIDMMRREIASKADNMNIKLE